MYTTNDLAAFLAVTDAATAFVVYKDLRARGFYCSPTVAAVDCGANYDGKGRTAILGVIAGLIAAGAGTPVVVHSGDRVPTQKQDAYKHVLDALGVRTELQPAESAEMTDAVGFGF